MIGMIVDIIWLASALAVLTSVVLFMLNPLYAFWIENKYHIDLEGDEVDLDVMLNDLTKLTKKQALDIFSCV